MHVFSTAPLLENHITDCKGICAKGQRIEMPKEGEILEFAAHCKQMRQPFIIYADFEALNIPIDGCAGDPEKSSTRQISKQEPCGYGYVVVRSDGQASEPYIYRGENAVNHFLNQMVIERDRINQIYKKPVPMQMTTEDTNTFNNSTQCWICEEEFNYGGHYI